MLKIFALKNVSIKDKWKFTQEEDIYVWETGDCKW